MEYSKDYIKTIASVYDMTKVAREIVTDYCIAAEIDEKDIFPSIWSDILSELYWKLFGPCHRLLTINGSKGGAYDQEKVLFIYENIYKRLCNSHCQEVSQKGFCDMSGVPKQCLYKWAENSTQTYNQGDIVYNTTNSDGIYSNIDNDTTSSTKGMYTDNNHIGDVYTRDIYMGNMYIGDMYKGGRPSSISINLHEKIKEDNEESLFNLMKDRRYNPMKILPKLNKVHGWNMSGVSAQSTRQALSDAQLPRLGAASESGSVVQISQNFTENGDGNTTSCGDN